MIGRILRLVFSLTAVTLILVLQKQTVYPPPLYSEMHITSDSTCWGPPHCDSLPTSSLTTTHHTNVDFGCLCDETIDLSLLLSVDQDNANICLHTPKQHNSGWPS